MNMNIHPSALLYPMHARRETIKYEELSPNQVVFSHHYQPRYTDSHGLTIEGVRLVTSNGPFRSFGDPRIPFQNLILHTETGLRHLNGLPTSQAAIIEELKNSNQRIKLCGFDPSWNAIPNITPAEATVLTQLESPNMAIRTVLESKQNFATAIETLAADALNTEGTLQHYLRERGLPKQTIEGVSENFRALFIPSTVVEPYQNSVVEGLLRSFLDSTNQGLQTIVIKGDGLHGASAGGEFVKTYHLNAFSHPIQFLQQVLQDMHITLENPATHFPLVVQPWVAGTSRSVQLSLPKHYVANQVNLIDFALTNQAMKGDNNQFLGSLAEFQPLSKVTQNTEQATHLLLAIEAVMHQILIKNGYPNGLPELIHTQAFTTFGMDFLQTPENKLKLIDLNPRLTGALHVLAQSYQQNISGKQGCTVIPLEGLTTEDLTTLIQEEGVAKTSSLLANFIQGLLITLGEQNNVELLPLKTEIVTYLSPFHNNQPMAILGQYVQFIGSQSTTLCQELFEQGFGLAKYSTSLTDFLKKYR